LRDAEISGHVVGVITADRKERIHVHAGRPNQIEGLLAVRLAERVQEQVLSLERAADWRAERAAQRGCQADQQRVGQVDDIERALGGQPVEHLADFLALEALVSAQHRHGQLAEALRIDFDLTLRGHADQPVRVPQPIEQARRMPENRRVLLQVDADAVEEHVARADVPLVGPGRRVDRREDYVVAAREELRGKRIVAQAAAAVHAAGAAGERQDPHATAAPTGSGSGSAAWKERRA
jgi:hypothetical protein